MAENTTIAWCDHTWNPWIGCSHVHTGCENCYAERQQGRFGVHWGPHGTRRKGKVNDDMERNQTITSMAAREQ
jgi:protein gp37